MGVSVLLKLFISGNEVCNTAYAPLAYTSAELHFQRYPNGLSWSERKRKYNLHSLSLDNMTSFTWFSNNSKYFYLLAKETEVKLHLIVFKNIILILMYFFKLLIRYLKNSQNADSATTVERDVVFFYLRPGKSSSVGNRPEFHSRCRSLVFVKPTDHRLIIDL